MKVKVRQCHDYSGKNVDFVMQNLRLLEKSQLNTFINDT